MKFSEVRRTALGATGVGLLIEEHRGEVASAWRQAVERELGVKEPALAFAVAPLLRELALAFGSGADARRSQEAWKRCAVLVRSTASPAQLAREFKLLHRCAWEALRARGAPISQADRSAADEWLDEALAEALDRLERVRLRVASIEAQGPVVIPALARRHAAATPPPLPRAHATHAAPPPLRRAPAVAEEQVLELEPIEVGG
jgi:hypothetical protein